MSKNLVIVESPAKAKTIEGFLGKDFTVKSSYGHIRDLPKKGLAINLENGYEPDYEITSDKVKVVNELKKLAKEAETVWLATDEDREGEAISWHLAEVLKLDQKRTKRIVFHEITKNAIQHAIEHPRNIDKNLVDAQQARRVLDRLVGFELSPVLWKKVKPNLSAGRVQSVTVRLIVEREREITHFKSIEYYRVVALFAYQNQFGKGTFKAECSKRFEKIEDARNFLEKCQSASFYVANLETKPAKKSPSPPFTTSTLQQEAARKLGYSVSQTMTLAQRLYESGKITYMRTDSVNLSETALFGSKLQIERNYGEKYHFQRKFSTKSKGAQEAHEAIRPTYFENQTTDGESGERRLYELIWKRAIASQMADALLERTNITIALSNSNEVFTAQGEVIKFEGFLKVYLEGTDEESESEEGLLPKLELNEPLNFTEITATQKFTQHPARYTEASLVKKLEELGIGRPSTYAPTISTIQKRGYVVKEDRVGHTRYFTVISLANGKIKEEQKSETTGSEKAKLFPTDIGMVVNDFLVDHFGSILDYNFTAEVEKDFDNVAEGQKKWSVMIDGFYKPFHKTVSETEKTGERAKGERLIGTDVISGKKVFAKIGRFGPLVQLGETEGDEKPRFASLRKGQSIETITLSEALEMFKLPRILGVYQDEEVSVSLGRFGPYVKFKAIFASLDKSDDPYTINLERAIELIENKLKQENEKVIRDFKDADQTRLLNGKWGPYISIGKSNYKIPKGINAAELTLEDCKKIASETPVKSGFNRRGKK